MSKNAETVHERLDLALGYLEVQAAKAAFMGRLRECEPYTHLPEGSAGYMTPQCAVACALAEVWRQGRKYQRDHDNAALVALVELESRAMT